MMTPPRKAAVSVTSAAAASSHDGPADSRKRGGGNRFDDVQATLLPLAAWLAMASLAAARVDPAEAAEAGFLGLLAAGVLAAVAALGRLGGEGSTPWLGGAHHVTWAAAMLALGCLWLLHHGPQRGAALVLVLGIALFEAARRAWTGTASPRWTIPVALGWQLLMRGDLLLPPLLDARTLVSLVALPVAAALGVTALADRFGPRRGLTAGAAAMLLAPGLNVTVTLGLLALAAGARLGTAAEPRWRRAAAAVLLLLPVLWSWRLGTVFFACGLTLALMGPDGAFPRYRGPLALAPPAVALAATLLTLPAGGTAPPALMVLALMPAALLTKSPFLALAGAGATVASTVAFGDIEAAIGAVGLLAVATPQRGDVGRLQRLWLGAAAAAVTLLAAYPWLRQDPLPSFPAGLGHPPWILLAAAVLAVPVVGKVLAAVPRRPPWLETAVIVAVIGALAVPALPAPGVVVLDRQPRLLTADAPRWQGTLPQTAPGDAPAAGGISTVVIDSTLIHAHRLVADTPAARVVLVDADDRKITEWRLLVGRDTGEWAARRPDVARKDGFVAPPPWLHRLSADGTFFGQRYRTALTPPRQGPGHRLILRRMDELPPEVQILVHRVEVR
ncbi:MAG: hypothetical protein AAGD06_25410 [Acidobacteriota bacterium]